MNPFTMLGIFLFLAVAQDETTMQIVGLLFLVAACGIALVFACAFIWTYRWQIIKFTGTITAIFGIVGVIEMSGIMPKPTPLPYTNTTETFVPYDNFVSVNPLKGTPTDNRCLEERGGRHELVRAGPTDVVVKYHPPTRKFYVDGTVYGTYPNWRRDAPVLWFADSPEMNHYEGVRRKCRNGEELFISIWWFETETKEFLRYAPLNEQKALIRI